MPTEVGISLALRRQSSLIKSNQEGRLLLSKQKNDYHDHYDHEHDDDHHEYGSDHESDHDGLERGREQQQQHSSSDGPQCSMGGNCTTSSRDGPKRRGNVGRTQKRSDKISNTGARERSDRIRNMPSSSASSVSSIKSKRSLAAAGATSTPSSSQVGAAENSWHVLRDGVLIYVSCMALPPAARWCFIFAWNNRLSQNVVRQVCLSAVFSKLQWCQERLLWDEAMALSDDDSAAGSETSKSVLAPDAGLSDFAIVGFLALFLASLRITLMYLLVPKLSEPKRMEALVRCKSIHLLSSSYPGSMTPVRQTSRLVLTDLPDLPNLYGAEEEETDSVDLKPTLLPDLGRPRMNNGRDMINNHYNDNFRHKVVDGDDDDGDEWFSGDTAADDDEGRREAEEEHRLEAPLVQSGLLSRSSAQNLQELLELSSRRLSLSSTNGRMSRRNSASGRLQENIEDNCGRVFAAPKYATAVFRLLFCLMSSMTAYLSFVNAEFWPPIVLGRGSTLHCWSLSSVGLAMDADFDQYNTALRRYYLIQASYHVHSAAFHVFTSVLLWFVSKSSRRNSQYGKGEDQPSRNAFCFYNFHTFFRHCFSIGLIFVTYLFSSTRRLGAIATFTLDLSNIPLHLLQIRINAPSESRDESDRRISIRFLHLLVLLSFCFLRIYVCIFVIAFSALEESQSSGWLEQLNSMHSGIANAMKGVFVIGFLFYLILTAVYFVRLLTHSHVQEQVLAQRKRSI